MSFFVSMLGCVALVLIHPLYLRCLVTQAAASCQMRCFLDTPLAQLRHMFQVVFDARLCSSCICASSLLAMSRYLGSGLLSDSLLSEYSTCVSCNKWGRYVSMLGCVALVLMDPLFHLGTQAAASCQMRCFLDTPLAQLRQEFFVGFDARLCSSCTCASTALLFVLCYLGGGLVSDSLHSRYFTCLASTIGLGCFRCQVLKLLPLVCAHSALLNAWLLRC